MQTEMEELVLTGLKIKRGYISAISEEGEIVVQDNSSSLKIVCNFLQTSAGSLPELFPNDMVLYAIDETEFRGYVLGVVTKYNIEAKHSQKKLVSNQEKTIQNVKISAEEKIELKCGRSSLTMKKDGKIVIKGDALTSRARGVHKIKGGAVSIN